MVEEHRHQILQRKNAAEEYLSLKRESWDNAEKLFHNKLNDLSSSRTKSQVFDPKLSTLTLERSYRVMAQVQTGKVIGISKNDLGDAKLKNLLLDKYVIPNANAQFDFLTKMRMVDMYSNIYGNFFTLVDWDVRDDGYVGPDVWLLNIRDVFPQVGAVSLKDSDYVITRTWRPLSYFEGLAKRDGFKNIGKILDVLKDKTGSKQSKDDDDRSERESDRYPRGEAAKKKGYFEVLTQFERDRWIDYCVDAKEEFRDIKNPHENGELPVDCKYSIPLLDDFMGMGDFERGGSMQMVVNSVWNLYLDAVKMSIFPPVLINKDNIAAMSSIKWGAAEKWLVKNQVNNSAQPIQLNPQGIATFNNTYQVATAAILNLFGTSDTATTAQTDPGFGKTPEAIQRQAARENTRDNADRFYMEQYLTSVMKKFVNLLNKKQSSALTVRIFKDELAQLAREYPEIEELYDEKTGKLTIKKGQSSQLYDYEIVSGSTFAMDEKAQQDNLQMLMSLYLQSQSPQGNMLAMDLDRAGFTLQFGELFKRVISKMGIQDWDKILVEKTEQEKDQAIVDEGNQVMAQALQEAQNINQIPVTPLEQGAVTQPMPEQMGGMTNGLGA